MKKTLKKPSDYAQFYFRIDEDEKSAIDKRVDKILSRKIAQLEDDQYLPKRNEILLRALKRGLSFIEKELDI